MWGDDLAAGYFRLFLLSDTLKPLHVGDVLSAADRALVRDEVLRRQHGHGLVGELCRDPPRPCFFKRHAVDAGENVDPQGRDADFEIPFPVWSNHLA